MFFEVPQMNFLVNSDYPLVIYNLLHFVSVILCWIVLIMLILLISNACFAVHATCDTLWKKYIWPFCCYIHCGDCLDLCSPTHGGWGLQWCCAKDTSKLSYWSCWTYRCCSMVCFCSFILVVVHLRHFSRVTCQYDDQNLKMPMWLCSVVFINIPSYNTDFINRTY